MGLFNRGKNPAEPGNDANLEDQADLEIDIEFDAVVDEGDGDQPDEDTLAAGPSGEIAIEDVDASGPYDVADAPDDGIARVDLGAIRIPVLEQMELHLESDQAGDLASAVVVVGNAALRVSVIAAPRSGGFWAEEMIPEVRSGVLEVNGRLDEVDGSLGTELTGIVPGVDGEGNEGFQPIRLFGIEGPRWCLHGAMLGDAATNEEAASMFEAFIGLCVVNRGDLPMAPGSVVPLSVPDEMQEAVEDADTAEGAAENGTETEGGRELLNPFERGPEITEIR